MKDCLFCAIASDPHKLVWENADYAAFKDIHPKAKTHLLIVPKHHVDSLDHLDPARAEGLIRAIREVVKEQDIEQAYKITVNVGRAGGQEIDHLHVHLLSDR